LITAAALEGGDFMIVEPGVAVIGNGEERTQEPAARQLAGWLEADGWEVRIERIPPHFLHIDVLAAMLGERLAAVMRRYRPRAVMHFAAYCYVGESVTDPLKYYRNNVGGTLSLIAAMRDAQVDRRRHLRRERRRAVVGGRRARIDELLRAQLPGLVGEAAVPVGGRGGGATDQGQPLRSGHDRAEREHGGDRRQQHPQQVRAEAAAALTLGDLGDPCTLRACSRSRAPYGS